MKTLITYVLVFCVVAVLIHWAVGLIMDVWIPLLIGVGIVLGIYCLVQFIRHKQNWR